MDQNQNSQPTVPQDMAQTGPVLGQNSAQPSAQERNRGLEMVIPINRSGWSIAAGYVALFNIPFVIMAPVGVVLGIIGLKDIQKNPTRAGRGRCWFAIIYGAATIAFVAYALTKV